MKNVIITGANGFVGSNLVKKCSEKCSKVFCVIKDKNEDISNIVNYSNVEIIYCDLNNISRIENMIEDKIDCLYHFSWCGSAGELRKDYETQLKNAKYSCDLVKVAKELNIKKIVFAASIMEYELLDLFISNKKIPMQHIYSIGKLTTDAILKSICREYGIEYNSAIISNIFGPGEKSKRLINTTIRKLIKKEHTSFSTAEQLYDFIYVDDAIEMLYAIGENGKPYENYYIGNIEKRELKDFLYDIRDVVDKEAILGIGELGESNIEFDYSLLNALYVEKDMGFFCKFSFKDGIKKTLDWIIEND